MIDFKRIYCCFPVDSTTSTDHDFCGKSVSYDTFIGPIKIYICEEHFKQISKDRIAMNKLRDSIDNCMFDSANRYFARLKKLNQSRE